LDKGVQGACCGQGSSGGFESLRGITGLKHFCIQVAKILEVMLAWVRLRDCTEKMPVRSLIFSQQRERELSELSGRILEVEVLAEARMFVLQLLCRWLGTDCNFWVKEPRSFRPLNPTDELLLATLQPIDMVQLGEPVAMQRQFNPFIKLAIETKVTSAFCPSDVISKRLWSGNPFRVEVCVPLGAVEMMAIEVDEEPEHADTVFVMVVGRKERPFTGVERYWFERVKWTVQPLVQHLRVKGVCDALTADATGSQIVSDLPLTPREREVFHWMVEGKRNKEIAILLGCSPSTIKKHVASILSKTGAETRSGALRVLVKG
jgi:DNA-binding CsgD family transcriptional regulator